MFILAILFAVGVCFLFYKLLHMSNVIGDMFRLSWNILMHIWSIIPGFGFMSYFVVADTEEEKRKLVEEGERADEEWRKQNAVRMELENERLAEQQERLAEQKGGLQSNRRIFVGKLGRKMAERMWNLIGILPDGNILTKTGKMEDLCCNNNCKDEKSKIK